MVVNLLTITTTSEPEGICYGVPESPFRLVVAPKRKNRWTCTLFSGENLLDVAVLRSLSIRVVLVHGASGPPAPNAMSANRSPIRR